MSMPPAMAVAVLVVPVGVSVGLANLQGTLLPQVPSEAKKGLSPGGGVGSLSPFIPQILMGDFKKTSLLRHLLCGK